MTGLVERGWTVLPGLIEPAFLDALRSRVDRLFEEEGEQAGSEFKLEPGAQRLANLADKGPVFIQVILEPRVLACIREVLGPRFKLSSLNARTAEPYNGVTQPLHADAGAVADEQGYWVANAVWLLDDFTAENGTLRAVPGSHRWRRLPEGPHPNEQLITGQAGDVIVMNAHVWHGGTANATSHPRRALHAFYTRRDKPQQQYQKRLLRAETIAGLPAEAREMLALDDPLNDELCSRQTGMSGFLR
ncbi:MAG: phytanoyl-CoA dioxygenase family protein [Bryobacterales bacterium]|nr:phytanoyl-CoA dioxygenase family protein [Bryobacterales bacterium]